MQTQSVFAATLAVLLFATETSAQTAVWTTNRGFGIYLVTVMPEGRVFFEDSKDEGEIEPFSNGQSDIAASIRLFGLDIGLVNSSLGIGVSPGLAITELDDAGLVLTSVSGFLQVLNVRAEFGWAWAISNDPTLDKTQRDRSAWFVGLALPTKVGEAITRSLVGAL